jgi:GTP-binding nuclear protein Ran
MDPQNLFSLGEDHSRYKLVIVGDGDVGKTTFVRRHLTGEFLEKYVPTLGVDVHPLLFNTNHGQIIFDIWDTAGQERFCGLRDGYAVGVDAVMGICDVTSKITGMNLVWWFNEMNKQELPSVACGNKNDIDSKQHKLSKLFKMKLKQKWGMYFDISAKSNHNFEKPFLYLARKLTGHKDLVFR